MTPAQQLEAYFKGATGKATTIGAEIETSFVETTGQPICIETSQQIMCTLVRQFGWRVVATKNDGQFISLITDQYGFSMQYELGHTNLELATPPLPGGQLIDCSRETLAALYQAAQLAGATAVTVPNLSTTEDLLAIPDERDAAWVALDGRPNLAPLATISSVQFTIPVTIKTAIPTLNRLGERIADFLADYPQEDVWRRYVAQSWAGYREDRYGGPLQFSSLTDYCQQLCQHDMVQGDRLVPVAFARDSDIDLFLRSVWWYFRLRRHGDQLCIEVRPMPRRRDEYLQHQLTQVLDIVLGT